MQIIFQYILIYPLPLERNHWVAPNTFKGFFFNNSVSFTPVQFYTTFDFTSVSSVTHGFHNLLWPKIFSEKLPKFYTN